MKKLITTILALALMLSTVFVVAEAAKKEYTTPANAVAGLTGRSVDSVIKEHCNSKKTYGAIAKEAGVLEEFKASCLLMKKNSLTQQVKKGNLTQAEANSIIKAIKAKQALCDGLKTCESNVHLNGCGGTKHHNSWGNGHGGGHKIGNCGNR